jgi:hypothetical protein
MRDKSPSVFIILTPKGIYLEDIEGDFHRYFEN